MTDAFAFSLDVTEDFSVAYIQHVASGGDDQEPDAPNDIADLDEDADDESDYELVESDEGDEPGEQTREE